MDVNQTRFHLLHGRADWGQLRLSDGTAALAELWQQPEGVDLPVVWDDTSRALRLTSRVPLFRRASGTEELVIAQRRGADRDSYGNWYWIDEAESGIRFLPSGGSPATEFWTSLRRDERCALPDDGGFAAKPAPAPEPLLLRGLAVTKAHYLVVGDVTRRGLLVFDLHSGDAPILLRWPAGVPFEPWDLAATSDGGLLVLDRTHATYWRLNDDFRLPGQPLPGETIWFQPKDGAAPALAGRTELQPEGFPLSLESPPDLLDAVSIAPGPDGTVLVLDSHPLRPFSRLLQYQDGLLMASYSLEDAVTVADPATGPGATVTFSVVGHDVAYCAAPDGEGLANQKSLVYIAEQAGNQTLAFEMDEDAEQLIAQPLYLPMRRWQGKALVCAGGQVYYDFADRWVSLQPFMDCQYDSRAVLVTPPDFAGWIAATGLESPPAAPDKVTGAPLDSALAGCVWHRLLLDAQIPPGTAVQVRARAADDARLLSQQSWLVQPTLYLRSNGCELPYQDPWKDLETVPQRTGTWELLFQGVQGRYLQLELTLTGSGRATPALRNLRAWYPRFSYSENYLPAIYREDPVPASFIERWLANFEGFFTYIEDHIEHVDALFDPRTAPADTLQWLACWFGMVLDPLWDEQRRRFFIRYADHIFRRRGTLAGLQIALRLYLEPNVDASLFDPACWEGGVVRIVERFRTRKLSGAALGDATAESGSTDPADDAHRFTVLLPHDLDDEQLAMAGRIVDLEKPAHTEFELKRFWDLFRVEEARLGLDTRLGESSRFLPLILGESYLAGSYLPAAYPFDVEDRIIVERDRIGGLRPL